MLIRVPLVGILVTLLLKLTSLSILTLNREIYEH